MTELVETNLAVGKEAAGAESATNIGLIAIEQKTARAVSLPRNLRTDQLANKDLSDSVIRIEPNVINRHSSRG
jgi:hypothetical protein